jgi:hypothetical protein
MKLVTRDRNIHRVVLLGLLVWAVVTLGCGPRVKSREKEDPGEAEMQRFLGLYTDYVVMNGKPPTNADEMKAWAKALPAEKLKDLRVENVETFFVSPRDNQPYVVLPNTDNHPMAIVVHEKTGKNGKRWAGISTGRVIEVGDAELQEKAGR